MVEVATIGDAGPERGPALHRKRALVGLEMDVGAIERKGLGHVPSSASISA
jgi:hypothetical protein